MSASEEFYRATASNPRPRHSPYALYQDALQRSTDRRQRIQEQEGAIGAQNAAAKWDALASIPGAAVQGYKTGQGIKGESQRQQLAEEQGQREQGRDVRDQEQHGVRMEQSGYQTDAMRRKNAQEQRYEEFDTSLTEEGQPRWETRRQSEHDYAVARPGQEKRRLDAQIAGIEGTNQFNQFQMGQAERQEAAAKAAAQVERGKEMVVAGTRTGNQNMIQQGKDLIASAGAGGHYAEGAGVNAEYDALQGMRGDEAANEMIAINDPSIGPTKAKLAEIQTVQLEALDDVLSGAGDYQDQYSFTAGAEGSYSKFLAGIKKIDPALYREATSSINPNPLSGGMAREGLVADVAAKALRKLESDVARLEGDQVPKTPGMRQQIAGIKQQIATIKAKAGHKGIADNNAQVVAPGVDFRSHATDQGGMQPVTIPPPLPQPQGARGGHPGGTRSTGGAQGSF